MPPTDSPLVTLRKVRLSVDAEVIVALTGNIMTMLGLPRMPSANDIYLNKSGERRFVLMLDHRGEGRIVRR